MPHTEHAPAASAAAKKSTKKKKNQPGKYSQLVVDAIRTLGERNGSSLAKIYGEAKKADWFDQQNGRTYLKYSVKALVQNDTLIQVKGTGANGSFRLNRAKLEGREVLAKKPAGKRPAAAKKSSTAGKKSAAAGKKPTGSPKKAKPAAKKPTKAARSPKKSPKKVKSPAKPKPIRARKSK